MNHANFHIGELRATIGNNAAHQEHRAGYNGLWSLTYGSSKRSLFVPAYAGLNHEHIFNGESDAPREIFFEPRHAEMEFRLISENKCELYQPPTPTFQLESWTQFHFLEPHYIDITYRCIARQHTFPHGYIGLFWASYINAPEDKSMYFSGNQQGSNDDLWCQLCTPIHNDKSTVPHKDDALSLPFREGHRNALFRNISPFRYHTPFYFGLFQQYMWIVMFDRTQGIRFTHSPSGGGTNSLYQTTNPAWDYQFLIPEFQLDQTYQFSMRAILRPRCTREEIMEEYVRWQSEK